MDSDNGDPSGGPEENALKPTNTLQSPGTDRGEDEEKVEEIKSTAVVKYSAPKPAQFTRLQFNTDLNMPPSNWLSSQADPYGLQYGLCQRESFSSFRMAHSFPDLVGEVDVISDAENIKNLLKIPYYKGHISMIVHRVENTLLLDNFDIHKHLMRDTDKNFRWLREFFMKTVDQETCDRDKARYNRRRKCSALSGRNLKLKFLYRSLVVDNNTGENTNPVPSTSSSDAASSASAVLVNNGDFDESDPVLPEPAFVIPESAKPDEKLPNFTNGDHKNTKTTTSSMPPPVAVPIKVGAPLIGPEADPDNAANTDNAESESGPSAGSGDAQQQNGSQNFEQNYYNRSVAWTFEDIEMLIGTDLPIFGGGTHPCISLRLRDMTKPISVLTGIDYWLDNLMCEVPEVLMCYHLNGIVQTYELVKTEDLPRLNSSKFSPKLIRDVAQHILSFLKSNATKAGHTYWLFKGSDEEVVKLYDLTSLCSATDVEDTSRNPFTIPVAMLLYRVARNMRNGKEQKYRQSGTVRMLLKNCVKLLPAEKYPEIVTSSHYMLSDLYVPSGTNPEKPNFPNPTSADSVGDDFGENVLPKNPNFPKTNGDFEDDEQRQEASLKTLNLDCANLKPKDKSPKKSTNDTGDGQDGDDLRKSPPPVSGTVEERCLQAIDHVADGLSCLKYFPLDSDKSGCQSGEHSGKKPGHQKWDDDVPMARSHEPIPMPYSPLNPNNVNDKSVPENSSGAKSKSKQQQQPQKNAGKKNKHNKNSQKFHQKSGSKTSNTNEIGNTAVSSINQAVKSALSVKNPQILSPSLRGEYEKLKIPSDLSWKDHLRTLLYEKAVLVYATLSEHYFVQGCYGNSLRTIGLLARSQLVLRHFPYKSDALKEDCLLGRAGDCCLRIVENWTKVDTYRNQYRTQTEADEKFTKQLNIDERTLKISIGDFDLKCVFLYDFLRMEQLLVKAVECYELAQSIAARTVKRTNDDGQLDDDSSSDNSGSCSIDRRLGNSYNELASFYLSKARSANNFEDVKTISKQAEAYLNKGIEIFRQMNDTSNVSLLNANIGHMFRVLANSSWRLKSERTKDELAYLTKAVQSYKKALQILGDRTHNPSIWDATNWDLCTALFSYADAVMERPPIGMSDSEREQQVIHYLQQTLQQCDLEDEDNAKFPLYQLRAAIVSGSLASMHHRQLLRDGGGTPSSLLHRKRLIQLTKTNYEKCVELFFQTQDVIRYFANQLTRAAVSEHLAETTNSVGSQIKHWQDCLSVLVQTKEMLQLLVEKVVEIPEKEEEKETSKDNGTLYDNVFNLNKLQKKRLQNALKMLTKLCSQKPYANKECSKWAKIYKECYRKSFELTDNLTQEDLIVKLYDVSKFIGELTSSLSNS